MEWIKTWLTRYHKLIPVTGIVTGCAEGADRAAREYARENAIPLQVHTAQWKLYGKAAGPKRNTLVVQDCMSMICFWNGLSPGTADAIRQAVQAGKPVRIVPLVQSE